MGDRKIECQLKEAVCEIVPDDLEKIWNEPVEEAVGDEWYLEGTNDYQKNVRKIRYIKLVAAACLLVCFSSVYIQRFHVASRVYIDGRQSIVLEMNQKGRVVHAKATDTEEQKNLDSMDLYDQKQDEVIKNVLDSMKETGSIKEEQPIVLLSVEGKNEEYLCDYLSDVASCHINETTGGGLVCDQVVEKNEEVKELEKEYQISRGKATLVQKLVADDPDGDIEKWVLLPIDELVLKTQEEGVDLGDYLECKESSSKADDDKDEKRSEKGEDKKGNPSEQSSREEGSSYASGDEPDMEEVESGEEENYQEWEERYNSEDTSDSEKGSDSEGNSSTEEKPEASESNTEPDNPISEKGTTSNTSNHTPGSGTTPQTGSESGSSTDKNYEPNGTE